MCTKYREIWSSLISTERCLLSSTVFNFFNQIQGNVIKPMSLAWILSLWHQCFDQTICDHDLYIICSIGAVMSIVWVKKSVSELDSVDLVKSYSRQITRSFGSHIACEEKWLVDYYSNCVGRWHCYDWYWFGRVERLKKYLHSKFEFKDLGELSYFLEIEFLR